MLQRGRPPTRGGDERWAAHRARRLQGTRLGGALSCAEVTRLDPDMSSTAYEYTPSANGSVDRRTSSSQRRARQQDAYRVFPRDPHALGVGTARLRRHPHTELHTTMVYLGIGMSPVHRQGHGESIFACASD